jgi:hypothetical protein
VDSASFIELLSKGTIAAPNITELEIDEKNKGNWFIKAIAAVQIIYLATQLLGRAIQHLAISTLELSALGMVVIATCLYFFWWNKPLDVRLPIVLEPNKSDREAAGKLNAVYIDLTFEGDRVSFLGDIEGGNIDWLTTVIVVAVFGACHLLGWNIEFPTPTEALLWRIASICCFVLPIVMIRILHCIPEPYDNWPVVVALGLYIIVRIYLIVECFIGLRKVPAGVYQTVQWSQFFPHI